MVLDIASLPTTARCLLSEALGDPPTGAILDHTPQHGSSTDKRPTGCRRAFGCLASLLLALTLVAAGFRLGASGELTGFARVLEGALRSTQATGTGDSFDPTEPRGEPKIAYEAPGKLGEPPAPRSRYPHIEPSGDTDTSTHTYDFRFEGHTRRVTVEVDQRVLRGARDSEHVISFEADESEAERDAAYYRFMAQDAEQAPLIAAAAKELREIARREGLDDDRYVELIAKFVQSIPYDYAKLRSADLQDRFPVETLAENTGVCGDKSILMAALLAHEGYDVALLLFRPEAHMSVGIKGPGDHYGDTDYLFIESTKPGYVSEVPANFVSGVELKSDPVVVPLGDGGKRYGSASDVARILQVRAGARPAYERLYARASARVLTASEAASVNRKIRITDASQARLQVIEDQEKKYLDRRPALRWIKEKAWWD